MTAGHAQKKSSRLKLGSNLLIYNAVIQQFIAWDSGLEISTLQLQEIRGSFWADVHEDFKP